MMRPNLLLASAVFSAAVGTACLPGVFLLDGANASRCPNGEIIADIIIDDSTVLDLAGEAPADLRGCERIDGALLIDTPRITSLSSLADLVEVTEGVSIAHAEMRTLEGLERLRATGFLSIQQNPSLTTVAALSSLDDVERFIIIENRRLATCSVLALAAQLGATCADQIDDCRPGGCAGNTCYDNDDDATCP